MVSQVTKGNILISEPFMDDPNFKHSVVLIADHENEIGTVGFILNRKLECTISDIIPEIGKFDAEVFAGGPVEMDSLHYIHNMGPMIDGATKVCSGIYWGGDFKKLVFLIEAGMIPEERIKFFIGYSGWEAFQLKTEFDENTWIVSDMDPNYLFRKSSVDLWKTTLDNKGGNFAAISSIQSDVILN